MSSHLTPTPSAAGTSVVHLRRDGTGVVLELADDATPAVLHWGADLGDLGTDELTGLALARRPPYVDSVVTAPPWVPVLPQHADGWLGRPGLVGHRAGRAWSVRLDGVRHQVTPTTVSSDGVDEAAHLRVTSQLELLAGGVLRVRAAVTNLGDEPYEVVALEPALPVPVVAVEVLDTTGRHAHERHPQRRPFDVGAWVREARGGRPGHDAPTVLCAGSAGFGWQRGPVWGVHLAWSGNQVHVAEHVATGHRLLRAGELLLPGEVRLDAGETYSSPWLLASWGDGLDELSARLHVMLRARPHHPVRPRPVLLNTWEAVHFDHRLDRLLGLVDAAAQAGAERFVLDDGWFPARRHDRAGLGDWIVDPSVYPDGLHPLVDRVHARGMEFGLWVEPEMVNLDSRLAREHPEWLFDAGHGVGVASRQQHVLDLTHPSAYEHVLEQLSALVAEYRVAFLKWDHNRALVDAGHIPTGVPAVHAQVVACYRMLGELRARHTGLEIESCAGGGARVDLGILEHTDRVWPSDCIDALERQRLQRWTGLLLPPELVGTHIGGSPDLSTGRRLPLRLRAGTAIFGHLGIEWDMTTVTDDERAEVAAWVALHRELRPLLHHGRQVRADSPDPTLHLEGVVAADGTDALFRLVSLAHSPTWPAAPVVLPGLDPSRTYDVRLQPPGDAPAGDPAGPAWMRSGVRLPGRVLAEVGVQPPLIAAEDLVLVRAQAVGVS
jgi:alpha-galactosidase